MKFQRFGMSDLTKRIFEKGEPDLHNEEGDDQRRNIFNPSVPERVLFVCRFLCNLHTYKSNDR